MIVKLLIFLCSVYVVKAYVAINIFDDGADNQVISRMDLEESPVISECSPLGCAQLCRRIGLKGGVCVRGKCKCDMFIESEYSDSQVTPRMDLEESPVTSECSPLGCAQMCQRLGLKGGVCIHGTCKCDLFIESEHTDENQTSLTGCDYHRCYYDCRSKGYPGGHCYRFKCKCDGRPGSNHVENVDDTDDNQTSLTGCDSSRCYRGCRSIGYPGGHCYGSECRCDPRSESNHVENVDDETQTPLEKCHLSDCTLKCRSRGFVAGVCIARRCICIPRSTKPEDSNLTISLDGDVQEIALVNPSPMVSDCNIRACEQLCRRIFQKGGACVNGKCKCDIIVDTQESNEIPVKNNEDKDEETDMDDDQKSLVGTCSSSQCNLMCRGIGFSGGTCDLYRDACRCY